MTDNRTWAVLPAKPFDEAKSRLESVLSAEERHHLAQHLLLRTLDVLRGVPGIGHVLVVSADPVALKLASEHSAEILQEKQPGLNRALTQARRHVIERGAQSLLVLAPDLPLLSTADVESLLTAAGADLVIAADRRQRGTNALVMRPPDVIEFAFGESSFQRHLELAKTAGFRVQQIDLPGLAFDLDIPDDWSDLLALGWQPDFANGRASLAPAVASRRAPTLPDRRPSA